MPLIRTKPPGLLPPTATEVAVRFDAPGATADAAAALGVTLPQALARASPKRIADYVAGRHCALAAIRALRPDFAVDLPSDDRAPRWPEGLVGSITHTGGFAWAAVARASDARGIGVDSESIPSPDAVDAIRAVALAPGDALPAGADAAHFALVFSAKESAFKCLHPIVRRWFGYEDAGVLLRDDGTLAVTLRVELGAGFRAGFVLEGRYLVEDARVHTAILLRPT